MEIKKIKVGGFRNISEIEIDVEKITGLLSINSYGKSNLLKAIEFGFDFINLQSNTKSSMLGWKKGFPKNKNIKILDYNFEITLLQKRIMDKEFEIKYGFSFEWRINEKNNCGINKEFLMIRENSKKQKFSYYIKREKGDDFGKIKTSKSGRCDKKIHIKSNELLINKLQAFDDLFYADIIEEINNFEVYIDRHLDSSDAFEVDPIVRKDVDDLKLATSDNIPRTLFKLKQHYKEKYEYLIDIYKQLFPKIENITIREFKLSGNPDNAKIPEQYQFVDYVYMLFCKEYNMVSGINFKQMSDGARRILVLLTNLILAEINNISLFCVEEPENSINPSLLKAYIEVIYDLGKNTKIIMTSHSPFLVNYLNPERIYIGCNNEKDLVDFKKINSSSVSKLYRDSSDLNMDFGEFIFELFSNSNDVIKEYAK